MNEEVYSAFFNLFITLFINTINVNVLYHTLQDIRKLLEPYGATEDIHLLRTYSTGKSRGCAFVKFCYRDDAIRAYMVFSLKYIYFFKLKIFNQLIYLMYQNLRQHTSNYVIEWVANLEKTILELEDIDK